MGSAHVKQQYKYNFFLKKKKKLPCISSIPVYIEHVTRRFYHSIRNERNNVIHDNVQIEYFIWIRCFAWTQRPHSYTYLRIALRPNVINMIQLFKWFHLMTFHLICSELKRQQFFCVRKLCSLHRNKKKLFLKFKYISVVAWIHF